MAKITEVFIRCDACLEHGEHTEATEYRMAFGQTRAREIALCEEHYTELLSPVLSLYERVGGGRGRSKAAKPSKAASSDVEDEVCEECGKQFSTESGLKRPRMALAMHMKREHAA